MIIIHWDYTDGSELSYIEGRKKKDNFTTCCLDFFNQEEPVDDVRVLRKDGGCISRNNLFLSTSKDLKRGLDIRKLLVGGTFKFILLKCR